MKFMRSLVLSSVLVALGASAYAASPVPRPAQPLEIVDANGKHTLASYKGKVVVVQFLLTTCPHCQAFSLLLNKLQSDYGSRGFQGLGAAVNEATPEMARDYAAKYAPGFPVGPLNHDLVYPFLGISIMDRPGFPQIAVIDRKGQIREQSNTLNERQPLQDEAHLRALVETLLKEPAGASSSAVKAAPAVASAAKKQ
jgi:thiol-disulfide isomerase/thioredoxin